MFRFLSPSLLEKKTAVFDFELNRFVIRWDTLRAILKVGLPAAVQMAVVNVSYLLITGMLNNFGVSVAAASGVGLKVNTFAGMPCWAVGQAVTAMAGQNMGADDIERVRRQQDRAVSECMYYLDGSYLCAAVCRTDHHAV